MKNITEAIRLLRQGEVVALPTETVYGLAADVSNDKAVAKIYALKNRPKFNPLIVHVYDFAAASQIGEFSAKAREYAEKYWPGPLTIVVPKRDKNFAQLASAGLDTIAIRVPAHPMMREVLKSGLMLAAPSANISGTISPTEAEHVKKNFSNAIDIADPEFSSGSNRVDAETSSASASLYYIDGGKCAVGLESTIITFDGDEVVVLREGVIQIKSEIKNRKSEIIAPGMLLKHYAPKNALRINAQTPNANEVFIGFGNMKCDFNLSASGDLIEAASNLFSMLHASDERANNHGQAISVASIPNIGVGVAINDKLVRAAS